MNCIARLSAILFAASVCSVNANAASIEVAPVGLDLIAPTAAAVIKLTNGQDRPISVQLRVFKWSQDGKEDQLTAASGLVVSPPILQVKKGVPATVRVVRTSKAPVTGQENYRILVDELPDPAAKKSGLVSIVVRQSLPVFFRTQAASAPEVTWSLYSRGGRTYLVGRNTGDRHLRLSRATLIGSSGQTVKISDGLVGYVLGHSTMLFPVPSGARRLLTGSSVMISADAESGRFDANVAITKN